mgnify:CR=1 FL=1
METSTAPTQAAVEASNSLEEEPSSVLETLCHPDLTAMQQHILDDERKGGILCKENIGSFC